MEELKKTVSSSIKSSLKRSNKMTDSINLGRKSYQDFDIKNSILRGELLRYSNLIPSVKFNLKKLQESNPKYLELVVKIIAISIKPIKGIDLEVPLNILLSKFKEASFENPEALDFTWELLNQADTLTSKYYLSLLAAGAILDVSLKAQFKAAIPFIRYMIPSYGNYGDLSNQKNFLKAISVIINPKADPKKIKLLPKLKYILDNITKEEHIIDVAKIIYSNTSADVIKNNMNALTKENLSEIIDFSDYLIKNSL